MATAAATATTTTTIKTLYRTLLRELPPISQKRTYLHTLSKYLRAQRTYATLLERYNPSLGLREDDDDDNRVRMSARRVGLDIPE
ncbi:hypothetical protein B9Z19DRAFT_1093943 [Tuber borchii]|uniref:Complex 1 LYR protein n=1 Tax=Tuber borchii TaxID=42251 RepID=A0A2T6ZER3_TUBBO|nr:hypothetical protein B9Z19DRAFT_1093943 [Tuber borchii]